MASVNPVHKKEHKQIIKKYRPISLQSIFAEKYLKGNFSNKCIIILYETSSSRKTSLSSVQMIL